MRVSAVIGEEDPSPVVSGISEGEFKRQAGGLLQEVRRTLLGVLEFGGRQIAKSYDAEKMFGVGANMSWHLLKLATESDVFGAARFIPPRVSMQKLFASARRKRVDEQVVAAAEEAFDALEEFIDLHAGDRARFQSMVASFGQASGNQAVAEEHRKMAYNANVFHWGVELDTRHTALVAGPPNADGKTFDLLSVSSLLNLRYLRHSAGTAVAGFSMVGPTQSSEALDGEAMKTLGAPVLPRFSERALPKLVSKADEFGTLWISVSGEQVGLTGVMDMVLACTTRNVPLDMRESMRLDGGTLHPTSQQVLEIMMHRSIPKMAANVFTYGQPPQPAAAATALRIDPAYRLPCFEEAVYEESIEEGRVLGMPQRREVFEYCLGKMGWDLRDFCVHRVRIAYPLMYTKSALRLSPAQGAEANQP